MTGLLLAPCTRPIDLQGLARTRRAAATPLFPSPSCAGPLQLTYSPAPQTFAAAKQKTLVQPITGSQPHGMMLLNKNSVQSFVAVLFVFDMPSCVTWLGKIYTTGVSSAGSPAVHGCLMLLQERSATPLAILNIHSLVTVIYIYYNHLPVT